MDVRLVEKDHEMLIALGSREQVSNALDERLPSLRVGPTQKLLGLLPRQLEAVQSSTDRLATTHQPEPLAGPRDEAAQRPARRGIGPNDGRRGGRALSGADRLAEFASAVRAKKGRRPPVRRNASASGPWAL
jgi:hypothetical protein